jgi:hypothetical protein
MILHNHHNYNIQPHSFLSFSQMRYLIHPSVKDHLVHFYQLQHTIICLENVAFAYMFSSFYQYMIVSHLDVFLEFHLCLRITINHVVIYSSRVYI